MINQAKIDGNDIWTTYKANLVKGTYAALLKKPQCKELIKNESRLEDGIRVIIPNDMLRFQSQEISISFLLEGNNITELDMNCTSFLSAITKKSINFDVYKLGIRYNLIYQDMSVKEYLSSNRKFRVYTIKFLEPNPSNRIKI